jgi:hypothetical protein
MSIRTVKILLSIGENSFVIDSVIDEIVSPLAKPAIKSFPCSNESQCSNIRKQKFEKTKRNLNWTKMNFKFCCRYLATENCFCVPSVDDNTSKNEKLQNSKEDIRFFLIWTKVQGHSRFRFSPQKFFKYLLPVYL